MNLKRSVTWLFCVIISLLVIKPVLAQQSIALNGTWHVLLDPHTRFKAENLAPASFKNKISIPGSLDEAGLGPRVDSVTIERLNRKYDYVGVAWYYREITIPDSWKNKDISFFIERAMWQTCVFIDGKQQGRPEESLLTPHIHALEKLSPGKHALIVRIDNSSIYNLGTWSHAYSDQVQTIWNGMTGKVALIAHNDLFIKSLQVYPQTDSRKIRINVVVGNDTRIRKRVNIRLKISTGKESLVKVFSIQKIVGPGYLRLDTTINLGRNAKLWDEFHPYLYTLEAQLSGINYKKRITFGLRDFATKEGQFTMNGRPLFLRGTHDAGNFPLTGYPSTKVSDWLRIMHICNNYGINYIRFHSWTPPEAAFVAADEMGIMLQCELPLFGFNAPPIGKDTARDHFLFRELRAILNTYGNHPSFCLMTMGNELRGDYAVLDSMVKFGIDHDPRHLYSRCSNPEAGGKHDPGPYDQFLVLHTGYINGKRIMRRGEDIFDCEKPTTDPDYTQSLTYKVPDISHEVGQWFMYPDYKQIKKYSGVLSPANFVKCEEMARANHLLKKDSLFAKASGEFALQLYKEEIERSLRTRHYGGFYLLDLHDYPGQGMALVGILNTFWDSKGLISPSGFRQFCSPTVPLLRMKKRVWENNEIFMAQAEVAHYGETNIQHAQFFWNIKDDSGRKITSGKFHSSDIKTGGITQLGKITLKLSAIKQAEKFFVTVYLKNSSIKNSWNIWVYPHQLSPVNEHGQIVIAHQLDEKTTDELRQGKSVLLLTGALEQSKALRFPTPFWDTQLFPNQPATCGIFCNPSHPALKNFVTDYYTDWQWWRLLHECSGSYDVPPASSHRAIVMDSLPLALEPIVGIIDDPWHHHRLGAIFECKAGEGKLLVCSLDLSTQIDNSPVAKQLRYSLLKYMQGKDFNPSIMVSLKALKMAVGKK